MVNIAVHLGSVSLAIVLLVASVALLLDNSPMWHRFFAFGVYMATWSAAWGVIRSVASQVMDAVRSEGPSLEYVLSTVAVYAVAVVIALFRHLARGGVGYLGK